MNALENLEAGKIYELEFEITGRAKTDMKTLQSALAKIHDNAIQLSDKLKIVKVEILPDFINRETLKITVQTFPAPQDKNLSAVPLIAIGLTVLVGVFIGGLGGLVVFKGARELTPAITQTANLIKYLIIGGALFFFLPHLSEILKPKK